MYDEAKEKKEQMEEFRVEVRSSISTFETEQFLYLKSKERGQYGNFTYQMQLI